MGNLLSTGRGSLKHARLRRVLTLLDKEILRTVKHTRLESTAKGVLWLFKKWYKLLARVWRWVYYFLAPDVALVLVKRHLTLFALMFLAPTVFRRVLWPLAHRCKLLRLRLTKSRKFARTYARLSRDLEIAQSYEEFKAIAGALDTLDGLDVWKKDPVSTHYDYAQIAKDCEELVCLLRRCRAAARVRRRRHWKSQRRTRRQQRERQIGTADSSHSSLSVSRSPFLRAGIGHAAAEESHELAEVSHEGSDDGVVELISRSRRGGRWRISESTRSMRTLFQMSTSDSGICRMPLRELMEFLRSRVRRNYCGINNPKLHSFCRTGTKQLITRWNALLCSALRYVARSDHTQVSIAEKLVFLKETRHAMGRTALCLSGGSANCFGFPAVVSLLCRQKLLPNILSGSSGGGVPAAYIASHSPQQFDAHWFGRVRENMYPFCAFGNRHPYASYWEAFKDRFSNWWNLGLLVQSGAADFAIHAHLGDVTFQEAYDRTGRLLNITVSGANDNAAPRLLNHLTAPSVCIWSAVSASTSLPVIARGSKLFVKKKCVDAETGAESYTVNPVGFGGRDFADGSLAFDLPFQKLQQLFNVNNFVVGQVNPHVMPFLFQNVTGPIPILDRLFFFIGTELRMFLCSLLKNLYELKLADSIRMANSLASQKYTGDVTIVPDTSLEWYYRIATNITEEHYDRMNLNCERSTWRVLSRLRCLVTVELCMDECISQLTTEAIALHQKLVETLKTRVSTFEAPLLTPSCSTPQWKVDAEETKEREDGQWLRCV